MRRIPLKTVAHPRMALLEDGSGRSETPPLVYSTAITFLTKSPAGGLSLEEMELALTIEGAVEAAVARDQEDVLLEEQHWEHLCGRLRANRFPFASLAFREFAHDILDAKKFDPNSGGDPVNKKLPVVNNQPLAAAQ